VSCRIGSAAAPAIARIRAPPERYRSTPEAVVSASRLLCSYDEHTRGDSNPEIAQSPFVTVKTAEMHLTHIYRRLDITGAPGTGSRAGQPE
jgi:DNA-binding NarL/FixJ family response regulator